MWKKWILNLTYKVYNVVRINDKKNKSNDFVINLLEVKIKTKTFCIDSFVILTIIFSVFL